MPGWPGAWLVPAAGGSLSLGTPKLYAERRVPLFPANAALVEPGTTAADPGDGDVSDEAWRRVRHGREGGPRPDICLRESVQQLGSATLGDPGAPVDDEIVAHPDGVGALGLEREHHPGVTAHVLQLLLATVQVGRDQLVSLKADPYDRHLRGPVLVEGDQVRQCPRLDDASSSAVEHGQQSRCLVPMPSSRRPCRPPWTGP